MHVLQIIGLVLTGAAVLAVVVAYFSARWVIRRNARRAQQRRRDHPSVCLVVIDEASLLFGGHPPSQDQTDVALRFLHDPDSVVWPCDLTQGPELGPWPKDEDGGKA
jgi:hypothetical protein